MKNGTLRLINLIREELLKTTAHNLSISAVIQGHLCQTNKAGFKVGSLSSSNLHQITAKRKASAIMQNIVDIGYLSKISISKNKLRQRFITHCDSKNCDTNQLLRMKACVYLRRLAFSIRGKECEPECRSCQDEYPSVLVSAKEQSNAVEISLNVGTLRKEEEPKIILIESASYRGVRRRSSMKLPLVMDERPRVKSSSSTTLYVSK